MGKSIDEQLQEAYLKKEKLLQQMKQNDDLIKALQKKKTQAERESIIRKIEASGFTIEDVLKTMEQRIKEEEE